MPGEGAQPAARPAIVSRRRVLRWATWLTITGVSLYLVAPSILQVASSWERLGDMRSQYAGCLTAERRVLALCEKRGAFVKAYAHPGCHRTSNPVDRLLRRLDYRLFCAQHLHGSTEAAEQGLRGWALIHNFAPSCPWTVRGTPGLRSPAERLNGKRYHPEWLQNLLVSASLGGYRRSPRKTG